MQYFRNNPSPFQFKHGLEPPQKKHKTEKINEVSELELCEASYHLLNSAPEHFKEIWDWSCFIEKFANHTDAEIRWIVCQSVAILHGMSEVEKLKLVMQSVSENENRMYSLKYFISKMKAVEELTHSVKNEVYDLNHYFYLYFLFKLIIAYRKVWVKSTRISSQKQL